MPSMPKRSAMNIIIRWSISSNRRQDGGYSVLSRSNTQVSTCSKPRTAAMSACDQGAGAVVGQEFEQDDMRHLAVEDDDAVDATLQRVHAGLDLRDHAAG